MRKPKPTNEDASPSTTEAPTIPPPIITSKSTSQSSSLAQPVSQSSTQPTLAPFVPPPCVSAPHLPLPVPAKRPEIPPSRPGTKQNVPRISAPPARSNNASERPKQLVQRQNPHMERPPNPLLKDPPSQPPPKPRVRPNKPLTPPIVNYAQSIHQDPLAIQNSQNSMQNDPQQSRLPTDPQQSRLPTDPQQSRLTTDPQPSRLTNDPQVLFQEPPSRPIISERQTSEMAREKETCAVYHRKSPPYLLSPQPIQPQTQPQQSIQTALSPPQPLPESKEIPRNIFNQNDNSSLIARRVLSPEVPSQIPNVLQETDFSRDIDMRARSRDKNRESTSSTNHKTNASLYDASTTTTMTTTTTTTTERSATARANITTTTNTTVSNKEHAFDLFTKPPTKKKLAHPFDLFDNLAAAFPKKEISTKFERPSDESFSVPAESALSTKVSKGGLNAAPATAAAAVPPGPSTSPPISDSVAEALGATISDEQSITYVLSSFKEQPSKSDLAEQILGGEAEPDRWYDADPINVDPDLPEETSEKCFRKIFTQGVKASLK